MNMNVRLKILLLCIWLLAGLLQASQISWLPCNFMDESVFYNNEGHVETKHSNRDAMLQFGQKGDQPINPKAVTFLITSSKLDLTRFFKNVDSIDQLSCELQRYSTEGIHVRWPVPGEHEYNRWFTGKITDSKKHVTLLSFIRQSTAQPPTGQHDYRNWTAIEDREVLTTTVVMVMKTETPSIKASLRSEQKLDCRFFVDHKAANVEVKWHKSGERTVLFSHSRQTGTRQGSGVTLKALSKGEASYSVPLTQISNQGVHICSVTVPPLNGSLEITLQIQEAPKVSLNTGPSLSLTLGEKERKVICEADHYYPLDVNIQWTRQDEADGGQRVVDNVLYSSHKHNPDRTLTLSAFFYLSPKLSDSGTRFTCSVSHQSLRVPIKKSFTLTVQEPSMWPYVALGLGGTAIAMGLLLYCLSGEKTRRQHEQ